MEESSFGRLVGVLVSPVETFAAISGKPTWAVALVVLIVIGLVSGITMMGKIDWAEVTRDSLEAQDREIPEEQLERIIDIQEKAGPALMIGGGLVGQPVVYLLLALVFMVLFKMLGGELSFLGSFSVILHSMMPRAVASLLSIPVILGKDEFGFEELQDGSVLTSNLGAFAPEGAGPALVALLSSFDLFSLWALALLVIGYGVVSKVSRGAAAGGVIALWVVYVLGKVGLSALRG
ncbi:MAG: YIP1 family protein [bacterium]|nr:YIP1 family protein [bacterium]